MDLLYRDRSHDQRIKVKTKSGKERTMSGYSLVVIERLRNSKYRLSVKELTLSRS